MPHDIFISYSRHDLTAVKPIKEELESLGFSCWMDIDGIESGEENFKRKIVPALDRCKFVLFFISAYLQKSDWTSKELGYAKRHGKRIVPMRFNNDPLVGEFDFDYGDADIIDWRKSEQKEKLLRDLKNWTQKRHLSVSATLNGQEVQGAKLSIDNQTIDMPTPPLAFPYGRDIGPLEVVFYKDGIPFTSSKNHLIVDWNGTKKLTMPLERMDETKSKPCAETRPTAASPCRIRFRKEMILQLSIFKAFLRLFKAPNYSRNALLAGCIGLISLLSMFS